MRAFALLLLPIAVLHAQTPADLFRSTRASLFLINTDSGAGSGFCITQGGLVATSLHLIDGATRVSLIQTQTNISHSRVSLAAVDTDHDLALLQLNEHRCTPLRLGNSDALEPGQRIYVLGNPLGSQDLSATISDGLISGLRNWQTIGRVIQVSAPLSHGNSGGPVLDEHGMVIGVVAFKLAKGELLNFAIPSRDLAGLLKNVNSTIFNWGGQIDSSAYRSAAYQVRTSVDNIFDEAVEASRTCEVTDGIQTSVSTMADGVTMSIQELFRYDFRAVSHYDGIIDGQRKRVTLGLNPDIAWGDYEDRPPLRRTPHPAALISAVTVPIWVYCPDRRKLWKDLRILGDDVLDGELALRVRLKEPISGGSLSLWFSKATHFLIATERVNEDNTGLYIERIKYSDFRRVDSSVIPFLSKHMRNGNYEFSNQVLTFQTNLGLPDYLFRPRE